MRSGWRAYLIFLLPLLIPSACHRGALGNVSDDAGVDASTDAGAERCGNGVLEPGEECDGPDLGGATCVSKGFSAGGTVACRSDCTLDTSGCRSSACGDGALQAGESCDDGNLASGDGCAATCTLEPGWSCAGAPSSCTPLCGDGALVGDEPCDDGNLAPGDGCSESCAVELGWSCAGAPSTCSTTCGDGIAAGAEACDGAPPAALSCADFGFHGGVLGCSATCTVDLADCNDCGDGALDADEACDDGNGAAGDGCSSICEVEPGWYCTGGPSTCTTTCGDGIEAGAEACDGAPPLALTCADFGFGIGALTCTPTCEVDASDCRNCGDGVCGADEEPATCPVDCGVISIAAGFYSTCAVRADGTVWCWGWNEIGQLGDGSTHLDCDGYDCSPFPVPVSGIVDAVSASTGWRHACAVLRDGTVRCWGKNWNGQLGDGTQISRSLPVEVVGLDSVVTVAAGWDHTCALRMDHTIWCWGANVCGQSGDGSAIQARLAPVMVPSLSDVREVAVGGSTTCAVDAEGSMWCWGCFSGAPAVFADRRVPNLVTGIPYAIGVAISLWDECALALDGTVWCSGDNYGGALGNGTTDSTTIPGPVIGLSGATSLALSGANTCALVGGQAWCWGSNDYGQLGDGTTEDRYTPMPLVDSEDTTIVSVGGGYICMVRMDGTAWCLGHNEYGQLGDGTFEDRWAPVEVGI